MDRKLFRIIVLHGGPKDSHESTETYLVAPDEEAVLNWIDKEKNYGAWADRIAESQEEGWEPEEYFIGDDYDTPLSFREWLMASRGDLQDENGWEDAYYGVTKWGWERVEASPVQVATVLGLGIATSI